MGKDTIETLKEELQAALEEDQTDFGLVADLSNRLTRLDTEQVRFSVDAAIISRLGRELVARQETAVSELVKNAYDADATRVVLTFRDADEPGGELTITDTGSGMTRAQLIDGFMRISSPDKLINPYSARYDRRRAGRKGIGRFAAQRLGSQLRITTQTAESERAVEVSIDWDQFEAGKDITAIANHVQEAEKQFPHGTTLVISNLADAWSEASIVRIYRYLNDLIQPFPLAKASRRRKADPGFAIKLRRESKGKVETVADVQRMVYDYATAAVDASVDSSGRGVWSIDSKLLAFKDKGMRIGPDRDEPESHYKHLKNVRLRAYYFIYSAGLLPRSQVGFIRELARTRGGIRLYRNGFRVLPYGEPLNDWLELDASQARRLILPPHSNINFFGFLEVTDPEGETFEETSSREGLFENEAYHELVAFAYGVLRSAALRVAAAREKKKTAGQKDWQPAAGEQEASGQVREAARRAENAANALEGHPAPPSTDNRQAAADFRELAQALHEAADSQEQQTAALLQELAFLRILASLGLSIGEFTHEVSYLLPSIQAECNYFLRLHQGHEEPFAHADTLNRYFSTLRSFTAYFGKAIEDNAQREIRPLDLASELRGFCHAMGPVARRYGIEIAEPQIRGYDLITTPMHPSEWVSIMMNFFTNSKKAIYRARTRGLVALTAGRESGMVFIEFSDNGDGIPEENEERIFDAFFTTTAPAGNLASESDEARGTGLGLKIVKDILSAYGGSVRLVPPSAGYATCLRVEVPEATSEEKTNYGF